MKSSVKFYLSLLVICSLSSFKVQAPSREYQVKAVFLYNFTQFVKWPSAAFENEKTPLIIGVLGDNPFGIYLQQTVDGEVVDGHPLQVKYYNHVKELAGCHILFVNQTEREQLETFEKLKTKNILTVGDQEHFIKNGGMIRFFLQEGKIRMQVNLKKVKKAELNISAKLLNVVEIVTAKNS